MGSAQYERGRYAGECLIRAVYLVMIGMLIAQTGFAQGSFHGHARVEKIKGDPSKGYVELYEYKAFLTPVGGNESGYSYHIGDPGTAIDPYTGCITWTGVKAGTYTLMTSWGEIFPRGKIVPNIVIRNQQQSYQDAVQPADYSAYYDKGSWDPTGDNLIIQTFIATGTGITRVVFAKADADSNGSIEFSIHKDNGGNVESWPQIGPSRSRNRGGYGDHWVSWQGGEVKTNPGERYAIWLRAVGGGNIQPYWCDDRFYPSGTGYRGVQNRPAGRDYYIIVFSDSDGTKATIQQVSAEPVNLAGWWEKWAQSYTAQGSSFAGSQLMGTLGGSDGWQFRIRVTLHDGTPDGPQIGPAKYMPTSFRPYIGVLGAAFAPGEALTTVGRSYWVVYEKTQGKGDPGFNACRANEGNIYSAGTASYYNAGRWTNQNYDLMINLFEYASTDPAPTPSPSPSPTPVPVTPLDVDFNKDGVVDQFDLLILIEHWHESTYVSG